MTHSKVKCEFCGQEVSKSNITKHMRRHQNHPESFETPRYKLNHEGIECQYCGKVCKNRNSLCNHERLCSQNPSRQLVKGKTFNIEGFNNKGRTAWNKGLTKDTNESIRHRGEILSDRYKRGELVNHFKGKQHTEETKKKISNSMISYLDSNPDKVPYVLNHSSKESYPETYFKELFNNENIPFIYHYKINRYELDFAIVNLKLDIEIDGDQHYLDKRQVESDVRRDAYLKSLGWTTFRIRWSDWKTSKDYQELKLNELKDYLGE